jgi:hypothetical protein
MFARRHPVHHQRMCYMGEFRPLINKPHSAAERKRSHAGAHKTRIPGFLESET